MNRFQELTAQLEQALSAVVTYKLDISDEVKEQVDKYSQTAFPVCSCTW